MTISVESVSNGLHKKMSECYIDLKGLGKEDMKKVGERAMELIGDYPLYASGLSNITYGEAIMVAVSLGFTTNDLTKE